MINTSKLRAKMIENGFTYQTLAEILGLSACSLSRKIRNISDATLPETAQIMDILSIPKSEIVNYFFSEEFEDDEFDEETDEGFEDDKFNEETDVNFNDDENYGCED